MPQCIVTDAATLSWSEYALARRVRKGKSHLCRRPLGHRALWICSSRGLLTPTAFLSERPAYRPLWRLLTRPGSQTMHRFDESHGPVGVDQDGVRSSVVSEKAHALHEVTVGDSSGAENHVIALDQVV